MTTPSAPSAPSASADDIRRWHENLQGEVDGAAVYRAMADGSDDERLAELYRRMAEAEERHGALWRERLEAAGQPADLHPTWRARVLVAVARRLGPGLVVSTMAGQERAGRGMYDNQPEAAGTSLPVDERSHARLLREVSTGVEGGTLARFEGRHRAVGGNALRAAVLGANDGLVSNFSLVMGVAGADPTGRAALIAGLAGLLAGAFSMALGEWLSVQSARELYANQIAVEAEELAAFPQEEQEELRLIYEAKGLSTDQAAQMAKRLVEGDQAVALDTLSREELGIDPEELGGSPWVAAGTSFALFAVGAIVPVIPFIFTTGTAAIIASALMAGAALFLVGAGITVVTGQNALVSGGRQLGFGLAAAAITFGIGSLLGTAIS